MNYKNKKPFNPKFKPFKPFKDRPSERAEKITISEITMKEHEGMHVIVTGMIERVAQTSGPTLFYLSDGSATLTIKGFEGAGVRAYPEIKEGDAVSATIEVREFEGSLEGEISIMRKVPEAEAESLKKEIEKMEYQRATISPPTFLVDNPILEKLKDRFTKAAIEIRLAVIRSRPIIVRHHNDCDGYSAGYTLEKAIKPLIIKQHGGGKAPWEFFTRSPCAAPFYEIEDSIKDAAHSLSDAAKFSNKMPLVLIVDNGSGAEDLIGIKQGKIHGMDFIVVDHHYFEKDVISEEVVVHINPFLVGEEGSAYSAGMLCSELARFINPETNVEYIPALSGLADRINNPKVIEAYIKIAEKQGYTKQLLHDLSAIIDFVSTKLRFMEAREYIEVVFGDPLASQKKLVALLAPHIRKLEERGLAIARAEATQETLGKTTLQILDIEKTFSRNVYPKPGKVVGLLHDELVQSGKENTVSIGLMSDLITIRATEPSHFSVHDFIAHLQKTHPEAYPDGGGHHLAGAIKFVPSKQAVVLKAFKEFIKNRK